jgi:hypothetical protein
MIENKCNNDCTIVREDEAWFKKRISKMFELLLHEHRWALELFAEKNAGLF